MNSVRNRLALLIFVITAAAVGFIYLYVVPQLRSSLTAEKLDDAIPASALAGRFTAEALPDSLILQATTHDTSPQRAQQIAQAHALFLVDYLEELETPKGDENPQIKATLTDPASYNPVPIAPHTVLNLVVAGILQRIGRG